MLGEESLQILQRIESLKAAGEYEIMINVCNQLLEIAEQKSDYSAIMTAYAALARAFYMIGNSKESFEYIEKHAELCERYGEEKDLLDSHSILYLLYSYNDDFDKAKKILLENKELGYKMQRWDIVSECCSEYSGICYKEKKFEESLEMADTALVYAELHKPRSYLLYIRSYLHIASAYFGMQQYDKTEQWIEKIVKDPALQGRPKEKAETYLLQGKYLMKKRAYQKASISLEMAKVFAEEQNDIQLLKHIQELRIDLYECTENFERGFSVQKQYIELLQMISEQELQQTAMRLDIKLGLTKLEERANTD